MTKLLMGRALLNIVSKTPWQLFLSERLTSRNTIKYPFSRTSRRSLMYSEVPGISSLAPSQ